MKKWVNQKVLLKKIFKGEKQMLIELMQVEDLINDVVGAKEMNDYQFLNLVKTALNSQTEFVNAAVDTYIEVIDNGQQFHPDFDRLWKEDKQKLDASMISLLGLVMSYFCFYRFDQEKILKLYVARVKDFCAKVQAIRLVSAINNFLSAFKGK